MRSGEGFTLVEVVLVLALIGLVAAIGAPRFLAQGSGGIQNDLFAQDVLSALRYAQKFAVATRCGTQVDIQASGYVVTRQNGCSGGTYTDPIPHPGTGAATYTGSAPSGVTLSATVDPFRFDSLGRALDTAGSIQDVTITVGARSLAIEGETGLAYQP